MIEPAIPDDEVQRLRTLRALELLDTPPEERFDRVTRLARRLFDVPIALVSLVDEDRQWFKSRQGLDAEETPREISFCGHAILGDRVLVVEDALQDNRFHDNPLVTGQPGVRFYAGHPLSAQDGSKMGTLCLVDRQPRTLSRDDLELLSDLAAMVESEFTALRLATTDLLTGLSNRLGFEKIASHALAFCARTGQSSSLLFFDMDAFKEVNDRFGHDEGDRALVAMSRLLLETFRHSDVVARLGGDEFCVVEAELARLAVGVRAHNASRELDYDLSYSVGVCAYDPARHHTVNDLLREADRRMYRQKEERTSGG
ncbi:MAG: GGDEF domain-containing protein [Planctomycetota bacterium]|jgi:diguanylate cyclase (GGDEF)-like protein